jgi:hypothetical protein
MIRSNGLREEREFLFTALMLTYNSKKVILMALAAKELNFDTFKSRIHVKHSISNWDFVTVLRFV